MRVNFSIGPYTPTRLHTNTLPHTHARTHTHTHTHTVCARACPGTHRRSLDTAPTYAGRHDALWSVTFHPVKRIIVPSRQPFFCVFLPQQKKTKQKQKQKNNCQFEYNRYFSVQLLTKKELINLCGPANLGLNLLSWTVSCGASFGTGHVVYFWLV